MATEAQLDILSDFTEWLGEWLGADPNCETSAYQLPYEFPEPELEPDRMFYAGSDGNGDKAIWTCLAGIEGRYGLKETVDRIRKAQPLHELQGYEFVIASPDDLGDSLELENVSVWDAKEWLETWEHHGNWAFGVGELLKRRLSLLPTGSVDRADRQYEELVRDIFRFLFYPWLRDPRRHSRSLTGGQIRDLMFAYEHHSDNPWWELARLYQSNDLVVEAKNSKDLIQGGGEWQLRSYLRPRAPGNLGVLVSRRGVGDLVQANLRQHAATEGVAILSIDDFVLKQMIDAQVRQQGGAMPFVWDIHRELTSG